ncbi:2,5-didehydrogluconate reductase DkgB [Photobacterium sp. CCB-ST2H9]|uniref:2,5-didehydrogluconate reductase DkgB n=1 Tax=Photobacterium sp. CCB-ST2H9 TaxID=2912855 RepID=UPI00200529BA|nr:2,5-didehydrogluconate reductase DkgB [Photobacterium sp. CCB-ST2H9]UTM59638.1 2,5-didehydrogluconate reductase DkgB [Photobacterium sp. CCB-ST2H9]
MNHPMPHLGFGTFRLEGQTAFDSVTLALNAGYRHIDTAQIYGNEQAVGDAIQSSGIAREDIFLTTKVWTDNFSRELFIPSVQESLRQLGMADIDLLLIHWPLKNQEVDMADYLASLKQAQDLGLTRQIGISNFTMAHMEQAVQILGKDVLLTNQIEVHPYLQNRQVTEYCRALGMRVTGYMPFAYGAVLQDPVIQAIAEKHQATAAQVVLAWMRQQGFVTIPSSTKQANIESNLDADRLTLDETDLAAIAALDRGHRVANPDFAPAWD